MEITNNLGWLDSESWTHLSRFSHSCNYTYYDIPSTFCISYEDGTLILMLVQRILYHLNISTDQGVSREFIVKYRMAPLYI